MKMTATQLVDSLIYSSYAHNRRLGATAEGLARVFPESGQSLEERFQRESAAYANEAIARDKATPRWEREANTGARDPDASKRELS
jgi:hypothetical protein